MTTAEGFPRLLADVGGTHARFAWQPAAGAALDHVETLPTAAYGSLAEAVRHYLSRRGGAVPRRAAFGVATPVTGDRVALTNLDWSFSIDALRRALGLERLLVLNDFEALALALPALGAADLLPVGGGAAVPGAPMAVIGPGTGLGVGALLPAGPGRPAVAIAGEGGHVTLPAADDDDAGLIARLRARFGHVSAERVLCGAGLGVLHEALGTPSGGAPGVASNPTGAVEPPLEAAEITRRALAGSDARCVQTVERFLALLGTVAGDVALTLGARGGVYIGGGIVPRWGDWIVRSRFRERFEAKGRFHGYLAAIPCWVIRSAVPAALIGAARALDADADAP